MPDWIEAIPPWVYIAIVAHLAILGTVAYLILLERKIASWVQDRIGPNRVGLGGLLQVVPGLGFLRDWKMFGLGQPLADGIKFLVKEDYRPKNADRILFTLAPASMIAVIIISIAVLPWGGIKQTTKTFPVPALPATDTDVYAMAEIDDAIPWWAGDSEAVVVEQEDGTFLATVIYRWPFQISTLSVGVLFILAVLGLAVYGVVIGGWASNNKYSFLGGLRATANMISYEIPLALTVLAVIVLFGTLDLNLLSAYQAHYWWIFGVIPVPAWNAFYHPAVFLLFLVCLHAEANRAPFDTAEAEQELVGGYHTEYSSMRFALFFLAEYAGMITTSAVCVALFFGGWHIPYVDLIWPTVFGDPTSVNPSVVDSLWVCIVRSLFLFAKVLVIIAVFMWVRWSIPRFRFDQILDLAWRAMIPISLALLAATALAVYLAGSSRPVDLRVTGGMALILLGVNVVVIGASMIVSTLLPAGPPVNRRIRVGDSRFTHTPLPANVAQTP